MPSRWWPLAASRFDERRAEVAARAAAGRLAGAVLPSAVRDVWAASPPDLTSGQLWRARWGAVTQMLLILESSARSVRAGPSQSRNYRSAATRKSSDQ
jgi:hypothetical protein